MILSAMVFFFSLEITYEIRTVGLLVFCTGTDCLLEGPTLFSPSSTLRRPALDLRDHMRTHPVLYRSK